MLMLRLCELNIWNVIMKEEYGLRRKGLRRVYLLVFHYCQVLRC